MPPDPPSCKRLRRLRKIYSVRTSSKSHATPLHACENCHALQLFNFRCSICLDWLRNFIRCSTRSWCHHLSLDNFYMEWFCIPRYSTQCLIYSLHNFSVSDIGNNQVCKMTSCQRYGGTLVLRSWAEKYEDVNISELIWYLLGIKKIVRTTPTK